jgi:hypothetical protein
LGKDNAETQRALRSAEEVRGKRRKIEEREKEKKKKRKRQKRPKSEKRKAKSEKRKAGSSAALGMTVLQRPVCFGLC